MPRFDKNNIGELKEFIYKSCPHDATVENVKCSCKGNSIEIELYNTFFNVGMNLIFRNGDFFRYCVNLRDGIK